MALTPGCFRPFGTGFPLQAVLLAAILCVPGLGDAGQDSLEQYAVKSCKFNILPHRLDTRAYTSYTNEVRVNDVFGIPSAYKRKIVQLSVSTQALLTLQAEVHRDTPTSLTVDVYRRGEAGKAGGHVLYGKSMLGAGGEDTKAFLHGLIPETEKEVDLVFEIISVEVTAKQVGTRAAESRCWPVRVDLAVIPTSRAALYWPPSCPAQNRLPPSVQTDANSPSEMVVLGNKGLSLQPRSATGEPYTFRLGDERPWESFDRALWNGIIEVPPKLHRFVRFFLRTTFHFASSPLQLVIELFDLTDTPDGTALAPKCAMGCLGGVPVHNGQILDHAMPTGFRYRLWLLAANLAEWTVAVPERGRHCLEFDLDYSVNFETRMTPFEVGPAAWLCESGRLPVKLVQTSASSAAEKMATSEQIVAGRSIWIRDRWGFPPDEVANMEHDMEIEVAEPSIFRATTHHADGVDVFIRLYHQKKHGEDQTACPSMKHPGPVPRLSIFCTLSPGKYVLKFFADYPLGGLHPCSDFFAQVALRPMALADEVQTKQCLQGASDLDALKVERSPGLASEPKWKAIKIPIWLVEGSKAMTTKVWSHMVTISEEDVPHRFFLRIVLHSDYASSDLRFQVKYEGKYVADTQVTSHGYADMIGPLDAGTYTIDMYYITGTGGHGKKNLQLCSTSMVDMRLISRAAYDGNMTSQWLCTSTRVPAPDNLVPQRDEQILVDSEYMIPESGVHWMKLQVLEPSLIRVSTKSADADFTAELRNWADAADAVPIASGNNALEVLIGKGEFSLRLAATMRSMGSGAACSTFLLNFLLQPKHALPTCPWVSGSTDHTKVAETQRAASDHIGSVLLDLVPKHLTKEVTVKPPVTLWLSQGMEKSFDLQVDDTAAIRVDVAMQPPFLPLEITVRKKRSSGKLEAPVASAEWTESRLLLIQNELPKGQYVVEFRQPRTYTVVEGSTHELLDLCSHVTISAEVGIASKEAINSMRAELLDLPDLLAVQPFPPNLNTVGWLSSNRLPVVGTQVYRFSEAVGKATLKVDEKAILRIVCEPADLSNAEISGKLSRDGSMVAESDSLGQMVAEVQEGSYDLTLEPRASLEALAGRPFLVTLGLASEPRLKEDFALQGSGRACVNDFPDITAGMDFSPRGWTIGPAFVRLSSRWLDADAISKVNVTLASPSILYIEVGSALPIDLVRIALQVPEGLWVGEQRGMRNSLEIELPAGRYIVHLAQPKPLRMAHIDRCLDFSVYITATPLNPDVQADKAEAEDAIEASKPSVVQSREGQKEEVAPREEAAIESAPCFAQGTAPLPLDLSDPQGGSQTLGGPLDKDGRLLIRTRAMLTDLHDGRKKVYLATGGKKLQMKVGVVIGGYNHLTLANQLSFSVIPANGISREPLTAVEVWTSEVGWERVYVLQGGEGFWLAFHHPHRDRAESACLHFGLQIEVHPVADTHEMIDCKGETRHAQDLLPESIAVTSDRMFTYAKKMTYLLQDQDGFLQQIKFTLEKPSVVSAEVGYNFFTSHAEMDIVSAKDGRDPAHATPLAWGETEPIHTPDHPVTMQLSLARFLPPGDYYLRVADDHYPNQLGDLRGACFPFNLNVHVVPEGSKPAVLTLQPHPSVPLVSGLDLVVTVRFSEPPAGSVEEVVSKFVLAGYRATLGGSMYHMKKAYKNVKRTTMVQAHAAEGHLVWVISWDGEVLSTLDSAKLEIVGLKGNKSGQEFHFNPARYTVVESPSKAPWSGGQGLRDPAKSGGDKEHFWDSISKERPGEVATSAPVPKPESESGAAKEEEHLGEPRAEGSGDGLKQPDAGAGEVHAEDGTPPKMAVHIEEEEDTEDEDDDTEDLGSIAHHQEEYSPLDSDGDASKRLRHTKSKGAAGDDDDDESSATDHAASIVPTGYRHIIMGTGLSIIAIALMYYSPRLKQMSSGGAPQNVTQRFRDIGMRTSEEELSLVEAANRHQEEDDML